MLGLKVKARIFKGIKNPGSPGFSVRITVRLNVIFIQQQNIEKHYLNGIIETWFYTFQEEKKT